MRNSHTLEDILINIESVYSVIYSGSVVECLTGDGGAAGSSLTSVTALCP